MFAEAVVHTPTKKLSRQNLWCPDVPDGGEDDTQRQSTDAGGKGRVYLPQEVPGVRALVHHEAVERPVGDDAGQRALIIWLASVCVYACR